MTITPDELLDLLIARSKALREAGVTQLSFDNVSIQLAPHVPDYDETVVETEQTEAEPEDHDPLNDPMTFGLNGKLPGFPRLHGEK